MHQRELKQYCRRTRRYLPGGREAALAFEGYIHSCADQFFQEQPDAAFEDFVAQIGTPEEAAREYLSLLPGETVRRHRIRRRHLLRGAVAAGCAMLAVLAGLVIYYYAVRGVVVIHEQSGVVDYDGGADLSGMPTPPPIIE